MMSKAVFHLPGTIILFLSAAAAFGQTTLFNIPTADTLPRGSWGIEGNFIAKPARYQDGGFQTYGYRVAYGVRKNTEIGSNFYYSWDGEQSTQQVEFSLKQRVYSDERHGVIVTSGAVAFVPLRTNGADKTYGMVYGIAGKTFKPLNSLTMTGGAYHILGGIEDFGDKTGAIVGVNQPIAGRLSFVADWFSGKNRLGYVSAGLNFNVTERQYLTTGYSFGNSGRGNNSFAAYYGITF